jgi:hypothetical protein
MTDILTKRMKDLPMEMSREIFSYLIPDSEKVEFKKEKPCSSYNSYSAKYEVAYIKNIKILSNMDYNIENIDNYYLTRIAKKNGKHRYYITRELVDVIQVEYGDREVHIFHYDFISKYIGKDLVKALFEVVYSG